MEKKKDVPNVKDEIRKLREALARKGKYPSYADELMAKKGASRRQDCNEADDAKPDDKDEQTANNFAARRPTRANTKN